MTHSTLLSEVKIEANSCFLFFVEKKINYHSSKLICINIIVCVIT